MMTLCCFWVEVQSLGYLGFWVSGFTVQVLGFSRVSSPRVRVLILMSLALALGLTFRVLGFMVFGIYGFRVLGFMVLWFLGFMVFGFNGFGVLWVLGFRSGTRCTT